MKLCPCCQYRNPDTWKKCEVCGAAIGSVTASASSPANALPRGGRMGFIVIAAGAGLLAGAAIFLLAAHTHHRTAPVQPVKQVKAAILQPPVDEIKDDVTPGGDAVTLLRSMAALKMPGDEEVTLLSKNLLSPVWQVRAQAVATLGSWAAAGVEYFPACPDKLARALDDANHNVRAQAAQALAKLFQSPQAKNSSGLAAALRDAQFAKLLDMDITKLLADGHPALRADGAVLAGATGNAHWKEQLVKFLQDERDIPVAMQCAGALARLGAPEGVKYLAVKAEDPDEETRAVAARLLANSHDLRAQPALEKLSGDTDIIVRQTAQAALQARQRREGDHQTEGAGK